MSDGKIARLVRRGEIGHEAEEINAMLCGLILQDQLQRVPNDPNAAGDPVKLTWYPGQDMVEGLAEADKKARKAFEDELQLEDEGVTLGLSFLNKEKLHQVLQQKDNFLWKWNNRTQLVRQRIAEGSRCLDEWGITTLMQATRAGSKFWVPGVFMRIRYELSKPLEDSLDLFT
eukprot:s1200_g8.t1